MSRPRHFLTLEALGAEGIERVLARAVELSRLRGSADHPKPLAGKSVALVMEKASTRTRVSFEVGIVELGGHPLALAGRDLQIGRGEPIEDTARVLSRYVHAIVHRTFAHATLERLAAFADVPVVNALSDSHHPCQLLADLAIVRREHGSLGGGLRVAPRLGQPLGVLTDEVVRLLDGQGAISPRPKRLGRHGLSKQSDGRRHQ